MVRKVHVTQEVPSLNPSHHHMHIFDKNECHWYRLCYPVLKPRAFGPIQSVTKGLFPVVLASGLASPVTPLARAPSQVRMHAGVNNLSLSLSLYFWRRESQQGHIKVVPFSDSLLTTIPMHGRVYKLVHGVRSG